MAYKTFKVDFDGNQFAADLDNGQRHEKVDR